MCHCAECRLWYLFVVNVSWACFKGHVVVHASLRYCSSVVYTVGSWQITDAERCQLGVSKFWVEWGESDVVLEVWGRFVALWGRFWELGDGTLLTQAD